MSNQRRLKLPSSARFDIPMLRGVESSVTGDFDDVIKGIITGITTPYIVRGFDVLSAPGGGNPQNIKLRIADSVVLATTATEPGSLLRTSPTAADITLDSSNSKIIGSWSSNAINYVSIDLRRGTDNSTLDQVAVFSQSEDIEIQKSLPTGYILDYRIIINTSGFGNFLPLYKVILNSSGNIVSVENSRQHLFRLGTGGAAPNPFSSFAWQTDGSGNREEESIIQTSISSRTWQRGDYAIRSFKDFIDAVETRFKEVTGSSYWYTDSGIAIGTTSIKNVWWDAAGSVATSPGKWIYGLESAFTPGSNYNGPAKVIELESWDSSTAYVVGDLVTYQGVNYVAIAASTGFAPPNVTYWYGLNAIRIDASTSPSFSSISARGDIARYRNGVHLISGSQGTFASGDNIRMRLSVSAVSSAPIKINNTPSLRGLLRLPVSVAKSKIFDSDDHTFTATIQGANNVEYNKTDITAEYLSRTFTSGDVNTGTDTITITDHGFENDDILQFESTGTLPAPLAALTPYYVVGKTANTFQVSLTLGGGAIDLTTGGTGTHTARNYSEVAYSISGSPVTPDDSTIVTLDGVIYAGTINANFPTGGPLIWDQDITVKGVIGDKEFVLKSTAMAVPSGTADTWGPGSVKIGDDDQIAYIYLDRDKAVGASGSTYTTNGSGAASITGPAMTFQMMDVDNPPNFITANIIAGDFVKFDGDEDTLWYRVKTGAASRTGAAATTITLEAIDGAIGAGTAIQIGIGAGQRPAVTNGRLLVSRGVFDGDCVRVDYRNAVINSQDIYWIALRKDRATSEPVLYLKDMELEAGESRQIDDNQSLNILQYVGAPSEGSVNPNYSVSSSQAGYQFQETVTVSDVDYMTNTLLLSAAPTRGLRTGDQFLDTFGRTLEVAYPLSETMAVMRDDLYNNGSNSSIAGSYEFRRLNYAVEDNDNLTVGARKIDREIARMNTLLARPVYDESAYVQSLNITSDAGGTNDLVSGDYIKTATGGGIAWVLAVSNTNGSIGSSPEYTVKDRAAPGTILYNTVLVHVIAGASAFTTGQTISQGARSRTIAAPTAGYVVDPALTALYNPEVPGDDLGATGDGQKIKLPPNKRAEINTASSWNAGPFGATNSVRPYASYRQKSGEGGGELLVIANDQPRECGTDFVETVAGPGDANNLWMGTTPGTGRAEIRIIRSLPQSSRIRFRNQATYGLPSSSSTGAGVNLQNAYNNGQTINETGALGPMVLNGYASGQDALRIDTGRIKTSASVGDGIVPGVDLLSTVGTSNLRYGDIWSKQDNIKTTASGYSGSEWHRESANVTTVGASLNTAFTLALSASRAYRMTIKAVGRRDSSPNAQAAFTMELCVSREGGTASIVGAPLVNVVGMSAGAFEYALTAVASGNNINVQVAGGTGHTVNWSLTIDYQSIGTSA